MLTDIKGMMFRSRFNFLTFYAGIIFFIFLNDNYVSLFYHYCCTYGFFGGALNHNTQKKVFEFHAFTTSNALTLPAVTTYFHFFYVT